MFIDRFRVHRRFTLPLGCDVLESSRGKEGGGGGDKGGPLSARVQGYSEYCLFSGSVL